MVKGEFLTDIRRAVVDADDFSIRGCVAVFQSALGNAFQNGLGEEFSVDEKVQVAGDGFYFGNSGGQLDFGGQVFSDLLGSFVQGLCQSKAGKGKVAVFRVVRNRDECFGLILFKHTRCGDGFGDFFVK